MVNRKIFAMHERFGTCGAFRCKDCNHLKKVIPTQRVCYKCELYGDTASEATDWRLSYQACGMFGIEQDMSRWVPMIEQLKHASKPPAPPIDGQVEMFNQNKTIKED